MHAVLRVDDKARIGLVRLVAVNDFIDGGRTIEPRRLAINREVLSNRDRRVLQTQMDLLIFRMIGVEMNTEESLSKVSFPSGFG